MFKYSEEKLYERCGYDGKSSYNSKKISNKLLTMNYQNPIPIPQYMEKPNDGLSRHIVLKTFKGFIKVADITKFSDIFDSSKYLKDQTNWIIPYSAYKHSDYDELIARLAIVLGKHWRGYKEIPKKLIEDENNKKILIKTKKKF